MTVLKIINMVLTIQKTRKQTGCSVILIDNKSKTPTNKDKHKPRLNDIFLNETVLFHFENFNETF